MKRAASRPKGTGQGQAGERDPKKKGATLTNGPKAEARARAGSPRAVGDKLRILILEDSPADAELIERELRKGRIDFQARRAGSQAEFRSALEKFRHDLVLSDFNLPGFDAYQAMEQARAEFPHLPFIVITGSIGDEQAVALLRAGVDDYLLKDRLSRLGEAVKHALENRRLQEEKSRAEESRRESEERFRFLTEGSPFGIALFKFSGPWLYCNPRFSEITGYTLADVPDGRTWFALAFPDAGYRAGVVADWKRDCRSLHAGQSVKHQYCVRTRDGQDRYLNITGTNLGRGQGILVLEDITERRQAGEALRTSEARYRLISENSGDVIWVLNLASQRFTYVSPSVVRLRGYTPEEVLEQSLEEVITPAALRYVNENMPGRLAAFAAGDESARIWTNELDQVRKDGSIVPTEVVTTLLTDGTGRVTDVMGVSRDISERKKAEAALRLSEQKFMKTFHASPDAILLTSIPEGRILEVNEGVFRLTGYAPEELVGRTTVEANLWADPAARDAFLARIREQGRVNNAEALFRTRSGGTITALISGTTLQIHTQPCLINIVRDISERKQAEEALRFNNLLLSTQQETSIDGILVVDGQDKIISCNQRFIDMWGIPPDMIRSGADAPILQFVARLQADPQAFIQRVKDLYRHREESSHEELLLKDGRIIDRIALPMFGDEHKYYGRVWYFRDISERKRAETRLRENEEFLNQIFDQSPLAMWIADAAGTLQRINPAALELFHLNAEDVVGKYNLLKDEVLQEQGLLPLARRVFESGEPGRFELVYDTGRLRQLRLERTARLVLDVTIFPIRDPLGRVTHAVIHDMDISRRREAEVALKALSTRNEALLDAVPDIIMEVDPGKVYRWANRAGLEFFGDDVIGREAADYFEGEQDTYQAVQPLFAGQEGIIYLESWQRRRDGKKRLLAWWCRMLKDDAGNVTGALSSARDITESRQIEETIRSSLREKEILLKEIHHRVKNNLTIVSSLLTMQMEKFADEGLHRVLRESQNRIWTMALIHQTLYQTGDLADIDMADYIASLVGSLVSTYAQSGSPPNIHFDMEPLRLVVDKAIPLALITNELVTNAIKHAFPAGRPGDIHVILRSGIAPDAGLYELVVTDNGAGLPEGHDVEKQKSLGLKLVAMLAKQLGGTLAIERAGGAVFRVTFPGSEKT